MASNAAEYADSVSEDISAMTEAGSPFGWINDETGEWSGDMPDNSTSEDTPGWIEASASDYLQDVLDIEYTVTSRREYRSACVFITIGGPNAWIDTSARTLEVRWGGDSASRTLPAAFIDGLDDYLSEMWEMGA